MKSVREQWTGWLQVAASAMLFSVFPLWFLGTTMWVTIDRQLNGRMGSDGDPTLMEDTVRTATWVDWFDAGILVAKWMAFTLPVFFALFVVAGVVTGTVNWRQKRERAALDAVIAGDAVIDDPDWRDPPHEDGIHSES